MRILVFKIVDELTTRGVVDECTAVLWVEKSDAERVRLLSTKCTVYRKYGVSHLCRSMAFLVRSFRGETW